MQLLVRGAGSRVAMAVSFGPHWARHSGATWRRHNQPGVVRFGEALAVASQLSRSCLT